MTATTVIHAAKIGKQELTSVVAPSAKPITQEGVSIPTRDYSSWTNSDGSIETGIWECDAGTFRSRFADYGEMIYIVQDEMICTPDGGEPFTLAEGDSCTSPKAGPAPGTSNARSASSTPSGQTSPDPPHP